MRVLGIETSCDETAIAIYDSEQGLLAHSLHSQIKLHAEYGGVVPELASRDHIRTALPLLRQVMTAAGVTARDIDGVAYTAGPGLVGALLVGATIGSALGYGWGVPTIGIHHMEAHLLAPMLETEHPSYPFLALLVSGGHTLLVAVQDIGSYKLLGESLDDAAGEAFDKTAKMLELPYPGGPAIEILAKNGNPARFHFPRPMCDRPDLNFSFSGLKTAAMNALKNNPAETLAQLRADIAVAFQTAVVDTLTIKCQRALEQTGLTQLVVAGGVGANKALRQRLQQMAEDRCGRAYFPRPEYCTDNAAMVAYAGHQRLSRGQHENLTITVRPRWSLEEIN